MVFEMEIIPKRRIIASNDLIILNNRQRWKPLLRHSLLNYVKAKIDSLFSFLGLFQQAIFQSGSSLCEWSTEPNPREYFNILANSAGCPLEPVVSAVSCLKNKSSIELIKFQKDQLVSWFYKVYFITRFTTLNSICLLKVVRLSSKSKTNLRA